LLAVATHYNIWQHTETTAALQLQDSSRFGVATTRRQLQHTATHCHTLQHITTTCHTLQLQHICWNRVATTCRQLQQTATHCNCNTFAGMGWQRRVGSCNTLQHTATLFHTLQLHHPCWCGVATIYRRPTLLYIYIYVYVYLYIPNILCIRSASTCCRKKKSRKKESFLLCKRALICDGAYTLSPSQTSCASEALLQLSEKKKSREKKISLCSIFF